MGSNIPPDNGNNGKVFSPGQIAVSPNLLLGGKLISEISSY
jgi:hypothetical protein